MAATVHCHSGDMLTPIGFECDYTSWLILTYCTFKYNFEILALYWNISLLPLFAQL